MHPFFKQIQPGINENIYSKDPSSSVLGKKIILEGVNMIDEMGLEQFSFKKLAQKLETTESSIYRYFENKHNLLIYLTVWYWNWTEYKITMATANLLPEQKLKAAIREICIPLSSDSPFAEILVDKLLNIIISESPKAYLTKEVDGENKLGFFMSLKRVANRLAEIILECNPDYPFPHSLASTIIESAHYQKYFKLHMSSLSDAKTEDDLFLFFHDLAKKTIFSSLS